MQDSWEFNQEHGERCSHQVSIAFPENTLCTMAWKVTKITSFQVPGFNIQVNDRLVNLDTRRLQDSDTMHPDVIEHWRLALIYTYEPTSHADCSLSLPGTMVHRLNPLWAVVSPDTSLQVILLAVCFLSTPANGLPTRNMTIEVPQGTTNHGDPTLLCIPPTWIDIIKFFMLNYFAHALTVVSFPGESTLDMIINVIAAIVFPTSGAMRGMNVLMRCSIFELTDLRKAARSGALYMVVRSSLWKPQKVRIKDVPRAEAVLGENGEDIVSSEDNNVCETGVQAVGEEDVAWEGVVRDIWVTETKQGELLFRKAFGYLADEFQEPEPEYKKGIVLWVIQSLENKPESTAPLPLSTQSSSL